MPADRPQPNNQNPCITSAIRVHAQHAPDKVALVFYDDVIGWFALNQQLDSIGASLRDSYPDGHSIALYLPNSPALVLLFLAGVRAGYNVQVFDHEWPHNTVTSLLQENPLSCVFAETSLQADIDVFSLAASRLSFDQVASSIGTNGKGIRQKDSHIDAPFYTGFTSGSSGTPKGFRRNKASWIASFANEQKECPLMDGDTIMVPGALSHSLFLYALMRGLHAGVRVIFLRRFAVTKVARLMDQYQATILYGVPVQIHLLMRNSFAFRDVRFVLSSGAKWPENALDKFAVTFPKAELCEFYGASELSFVAISKASEGRPGNSVGRAFCGVEVSIRSADGETCLPTGSEGSIFVKSDMVFDGYANHATGCVIAPDGVISVGDIGRIDENSNLFLLGRMDRMLVCAGKNVYPEEVERVLISHPGISEVMVSARSDDKRGQRLVAIIKPDGSVKATTRTLIEYCRMSLPAYKIPREFRTCDDWPRTRSGKTDGQTLKHMLDIDGLEAI